MVGGSPKCPWSGGLQRAMCGFRTGGHSSAAAVLQWSAGQLHDTGGQSHQRVALSLMLCVWKA
jgi:hypothetical protein